MTINDRVKQVRKELNMNQESFGKRLGITKSAISIIESGKNNVTGTLIKLLLSEFNVDPFWLESGEGDMFTAIPETLIDSLVDEFKLDEYDRLIIETYLQAPNAQREAAKDFLLTLVEKVNKKSGN